MFFHGCCFTFNVCQLQDQDAIALCRFFGDKTQRSRVLQTLELLVHHIRFISTACQACIEFTKDKQLQCLYNT